MKHKKNEQLYEKCVTPFAMCVTLDTKKYSSRRPEYSMYVCLSVFVCGGPFLGDLRTVPPTWGFFSPYSSKFVPKNASFLPTWSFC